MTTSPEPVTRFDHITIRARSIDDAVRDYCVLLGREPTWRGDHPELGTQGALFGVGNAIIELTAPHPEAAEAEALRDHVAAHGPGLQAFAFGSDDAARTSRQLRERGVRATPPQSGQARDAQGNVRNYTTVDISPRLSRGLSVLVVERSDFAALAAREVRPDAADALDHLAIRTSNIDAAKTLYGQGLGVRLALERDLNGVRMLFFRVGGVTLEVIEDASLAGNGEMDVYYGATYRVRDLAATHARLQAAGLNVSEMRNGTKPGTTVFSVRDRAQGVPTLILRDPARD